MDDLGGGFPVVPFACVGSVVVVVVDEPFEVGSESGDGWFGVADE